MAKILFEIEHSQNCKRNNFENCAIHSLAMSSRS